MYVCMYIYVALQWFDYQLQLRHNALVLQVIMQGCMGRPFDAQIHALT